MTIDRVRSEFGGYSEAVTVQGSGRWIHIAGQIATDSDGELIDGGLAEQTGVAIDRIEEILNGVGADLANLVSTTVYLTNLEDFAEFSKVRGDRFGDNLPASSAVQVADLLLGAAVEIDAVAFVPDAQ